jgi:ABC-type sugar transport system substrate-binding protein
LRQSVKTHHCHTGSVKIQRLPELRYAGKPSRPRAAPGLRDGGADRGRIITIDRDVSDPTVRFAFIGDNDTKLGQQETTSCLQSLQASGLPKPWHTVIQEGTLGASTAVDRVTGATSTLKPYIANGSVKVALNQSANFDTATAQSLMNTKLAIAAAERRSASAAHRAARKLISFLP